MRRRGVAQERRSLHEEPIVNLTPLIDVVFVVLIMFIVVAPLLESDEVLLAPNTSKSTHDVSALEKRHPLSIYVRQDNSIWFQKRVVTPEVLTALLKRERERYPGTTPMVFHDKRAQFGTYQALKGAVEAAGFQEMDVILRPG